MSQLNVTISEQNAKIEQLTSTLAVNQAVTKQLQNKIVQLERMCHANNQYSRRETLEIVGIPESVKDADLEREALDIFNSVGVASAPIDIHACHRIKGGKTIVKLVYRKQAQAIAKNKMKLKNVKFGDDSVLSGKKLFINDSLCPYYKFLWSKCNELRKKGMIFSVRTNNGTVNVKLSENGGKKIITHLCDLEQLFPDHDFSRKD